MSLTLGSINNQSDPGPDPGPGKDYKEFIGYFQFTGGDNRESGGDDSIWFTQTVIPWTVIKSDFDEPVNIECYDPVINPGYRAFKVSTGENRIYELAPDINNENAVWGYKKITIEFVGGHAPGYSNYPEYDYFADFHTLLIYGTETDVPQNEGEFFFHAIDNQYRSTEFLDDVILIRIKIYDDEL